MSLVLYNSLTRRKEAFVPLNPGEVRMYVCGVTVYDDCHIGHARMMVAFDVVQRWLRASGHQVTYVRNITDIDDKIIRRALDNGETIGALTARYIQAMHEDLNRLGVQAPDVEPHATDYIPQMQGLISRLQERELAYQASDGDVNFAVRRFEGYGKLSGKSLDELRAGERIAVTDAKQDPLDFVLWKRAKPGEPAEAVWPSPWGPGRPGWHIECSAMGCALLGEQFDIHGGGADLQFPHHENEIAQSEGATGKPFVRYWLHNGFVNVNEEKMSKSLGNFFTIREVLQHVEPEVLRFFLVRTHYRSPLNFADTLVADARAGLARLYTALQTVAPAPAAPIDWSQPQAQAFRQAMDDDFNTPLALAALFDLAGEVHRGGSSAAAGLLRDLGGVLGLLQLAPQDFLRAGVTMDEATIAQRITERTQAKQARDFALADRIRDELAAQGIALQDSPQGTTWRRA